MTQLEMMTSTVLSATGSASISPNRNSTLVNPFLRAFSFAFANHLVRHVDADDVAGFADSARSEKTIETRSGTEIENDLPGLKRSDGERIAATKPEIRSFAERFIFFRITERFAARAGATFIAA